MDNQSLKQFLVDSNKVGYAAGEEKKWVKESDCSTTISFKKGSFRSHDNFFGGEPYGGRMIVFYEGKPVWIMVYYGLITKGIETDLVYKVLRNALKQMPEDYPYRGPSEYREDSYTYINIWEGGVDRFSGEEKIIQDDKLIYKANYIGGFVDQRRGI